MPTIVKLKNSVTTSAAPSSLVQGEVAVNVTDKKVWVGNAASGVVQILGAGATVSGTDVSYTGTLTGGTGVVNLGSGQFYKDASGNIGIGTSSPAVKVEVAGTGVLRLTNASGDAQLQLKASGTNPNYISYNLGGAGAMAFYDSNAGAERMRIDSSGNVGIGTSSPSYKLDINRGSVGLVARFSNGVDAALAIGAPTGGITYNQTDGGYQAWQIAGAERMRIDSGGNLLVGTTSNTVGGGSCKAAIVSDLQFTYGLGINSTQTTGTGYFHQFAYNGTQVGFISTNGTTTTYNTSSDYRLKENINPMIGALATVQQLKPVTYKWKVDGSNGQGFIAHELQAVVPDCVTGEKDGLDKDGKPAYQGIDTSFLVATLVSAIQELKAEIDLLKGK